jgi:hypothetical protein
VAPFAETDATKNRARATKHFILIIRRLLFFFFDGLICEHPPQSYAAAKVFGGAEFGEKLQKIFTRFFWVGSG